MNKLEGNSRFEEMRNRFREVNYYVDMISWEDIMVTVLGNRRGL